MMSLVTELLWTLRRAGLAISTAEAIDLFRAFALLGFDDRDALLGATEAILGRSPDAVAVIRATFARYFDPTAAHGRHSRARLVADGFSPEELAVVERVLRDMLTVSGSEEAAVLLALLADGPEMAALVRSAAVRRFADGVQNVGEVGYFAERAAQALGVSDATRQLAAIRGELGRALGEEKASRLLAALSAEVRHTRSDVRQFVEATLSARVREAAPRPEDARTVPFAQLSDEERSEVERAVRLLAERLRGGARVRLRHRGRGPLAGRQTMRAALRSGGVPTRLQRSVRKRERPRLWLLCDVSDSVRAAATFLLAFVAAVADLFAEVRAFVFVADAVEITADLRRDDFPRLVSRLASGSVVPLHETSHYGRVLAGFEGRHAREIARRDVIVILGDGRTNHRPARAEIVARLRDRASALFWLCPEPVGAWGVGDSAMRLYAASSTVALPAASARDLEVAARKLVHG